MKNKEIEEFDKKQLEELLKRLKDINNFTGFKDGAFKYYLGKYEADLLLSYIEQLEKRNKELYEGFMATQEELTDYATKNEQLETEIKEANESVTWWQNRYNAIERDKKQLENNRDKAIEYIKEEQICEKHEGGYTHQGEDYYVLYNSDVLLNILKGDSNV